MSNHAIDVPGVTAAGFAALKRNDTEAARVAFGQAVAADATDVRAWFGLSLLHRGLGADAAENQALDQVLARDARHLPALIAKGDLHARNGDSRAAGSYYGAAGKLAATLAAPSSEVRAELQRIDGVMQGFKRDYETHLLEALRRDGLGEAGTERFGHAVDLLLGRRQIYLQEPQYFFFPELPQIQFYDKRVFPWASKLERQVAAIQTEVSTLLTAGADFAPYIQAQANRPAFDPRGLLNNPDWGAYYLIKNGAEVADNAARCPRTLAALREVPLCRIDGRTPSVLFSLLRPGMRIPPHHGFTNARLICHLPLIVPPGCALRVGNETRIWRTGELAVFDDSIEHEAWNSSGQVRVVLLFDIWRPELSGRERTLVTSMLQSIDRFGGPTGQWTE